MTTPAVYAEGLRAVWFLASRGVSATWDGATVVLAPLDSAVDAQTLEAVLRPDADGRSYLQRERERHALFLRKVKRSRPTDASNRQWQAAVEGLESFLLSGWGDEAERLGWPKNELYAIPPLWSRVDLCGAGLLIGDNEVTEVTASRIGIRTASGSTLGFYRKPQVDYGAVYRERLRMAGEDRFKEEVQLRAVEHTVNVCCANTGLDLEAAKKIVLAAIGRIPTKETASA